LNAFIIRKKLGEDNRESKTDGGLKPIVRKYGLDFGSWRRTSTLFTIGDKVPDDAGGRLEVQDAQLMH
jgi:hypothetical protein